MNWTSVKESARQHVAEPVASSLKASLAIWFFRLIWTAAAVGCGTAATVFVMAPAAEEGQAFTSPIDYEGVPYEVPGFEHEGHDHAIAEANGDGKRWPTASLTYWIDMRGTDRIRPALSESAIREAFRAAWGWWCEEVAITATEVPTESQALIRHRFGTVDGPSGTLAWSYLADGTMRPKEQRYDVSERWTSGMPAPNLLSLRTVAAHEIGHVLGLGHDDINAPALMRPSYSANIPREQPRDIDRLFSLGYQKRIRGGGAGGDGLLAFPVTAKASDLADALKKSGWKVEPPAP